MNQLRHIVLSSALAFAATAGADDPATTPSKGLHDFSRPTSNSHDDFLDVDQAFDLTAKAKDDHSIGLTWIIAPGYYLYRGKISINAEPASAHLGSLELPRGKVKHDEYFGDTQVYYEILDARVPIKSDTKKVLLQVTYQGCAEEGLCYNPVTKRVAVDLP